MSRITLAQAVWAVCTSNSFAEAVRKAVDLGDDADTVACVTGALAGATWGVQAIPSAWASVLHGRVPGDPQPPASDLAMMQALALRLTGAKAAPMAAIGAGLPIVQIAPQLSATDLCVLGKPS